MKKVFYSILLLSGISGVFSACTGAAYDASPNSNANYVINPLEPLTASQFTWGAGTTPTYASGTGVMGGVINGAAWATNNVTWNFHLGLETLVGSVGSQIMNLKILNAYADNIYPLGFHQYNDTCIWSDSVGTSYYVYYSYNGNSGEAYITENDSAYISGMFYCECISSTGQITAINNGYFNFAKPNP